MLFVLVDFEPFTDSECQNLVSLLRLQYFKSMSGFSFPFCL